MTIYAVNRKKLFMDAPLVEMLIRTLHDEFHKACFSVEAYCFMPDHCHVLAGALAQTSDLARAVRLFKGVSANRARKMGLSYLWQRDYYDHILRSGESAGAVAIYIFSNPVRAGLISDPHHWPFSGSFTFDWKALPAPAHEFVPGWK